MGIRKGEIVRIHINNKPIGQYFKVSLVEGKGVYCNPIENGKLNREKTYFLKKEKLISVKFTGNNTARSIVEEVCSSNNQIVILPQTAAWDKIISLKKEHPNMILHLYSNAKVDVYINFTTGVHTINKDTKKPEIILFGVERIC